MSWVKNSKSFGFPKGTFRRLAEEVRDLLDGRVHVPVLPRGGGELQGVLFVGEGLHQGRDGHDDKVVPALAEDLPPFAHDADDRELLAPDPDLLADGPLVREEDLRGLGAEDADRGTAEDLGGGQVPPLPGKEEGEDRRELLVDPGDDRAVALDVPVPDVDGLERVEVERDGHALDQGAGPLDLPGVVEGEVLPLPLLLAPLAHLDGPVLLEEDDVRARRLELGPEGPVEALDDRDHPDHGHDADDDAQDRQKGPELVRPDGIQGHAEDLAEDAEADHCSVLRASTGSSRAARLAG